MPIPKPNKNENQNDFVSRCIPELYPAEYDQQQAAAVCVRTYEEANQNLTTAEKVNMKIVGMQIKNKYKGIVLKDENDPCTEGYEQYGMKDGDDGRPVPNCIPIKEE